MSQLNNCVDDIVNPDNDNYVDVESISSCIDSDVFITQPCYKWYIDKLSSSNNDNSTNNTKTSEPLDNNEQVDS